jgi:ABC-2 type transport system ATP-binding protein
VTAADRHDGAVGFEVESAQGEDIRRELARAVVAEGWGLLELRPTGMSLEQIFLQLTTSEEPQAEATQTEVAHA